MSIKLVSRTGAYNRTRTLSSTKERLHSFFQSFVLSCLLSFFSFLINKSRQELPKDTTCPPNDVKPGIKSCSAFSICPVQLQVNRCKMTRNACAGEKQPHVMELSVTPKVVASFCDLAPSTATKSGPASSLTTFRPRKVYTHTQCS